MPRHKKDETNEMNFHRMLNTTRQFREVTLEQVCAGLCSVSMMKRIECGERIPQKQMRDRILARMGVPLDGYEEYLSVEEFKQWELRQKLLKSIENKKVTEAETYLNAYRVYEKQNPVEAQYCDAMELMILQMKKAPVERQQAVVAHAVGLTMQGIENGLSENRLLSEQELNLLAEYVRLREYNGVLEKELEWREKQYQEILQYIEHSLLDDFCRAKIYPKVVYYLSEHILNKEKTEETLRTGIKRCNEAIELLRDSRKLYYFIELVAVLEKLVTEYEICLKQTNRQGEIEELQRNLQEKKRWRDIIMELYNEHDVSPYMEHFCHFYWGMETYCISDVIRIRRQMFGMTKEKLCEGICSVKTLTRIEHKKAKTQMAIVRKLFERVGLCAEYLRTRVVTSDYCVMKLSEEFAWYINNYKMEEAEKSSKELEQRLNLDIPQNKQFMDYYKYLSELQKKEISKEEFIEKMIEVIGYTIPVACIIKKGDKFLTQEEYTYIRAIGMRAENEMSEKFMEIIHELCTTEEVAGGHVKKYEFLMLSIISYLGNIGEYKESDRLSIKLARHSLAYRRSYVLAETLYNNLWNEQEMAVEQPKSENTKKENIIRDCLLLSKYNKVERDIIFLERELETYLKG